MRFSLLIVAAALAGAAISEPAAAAPARAWVHDSGLIKLAPNRPPQRGDNAMDRLMIQDTMARWGIAYDEGRSDVIRSLFTEDAVFEVMLGSNVPIASVKGNEAIANSTMLAIQRQGDQRRHAISNIVIQDLARDHATVIAYAVVVVPADPTSINATVVYSGDVRKDSVGTWRFRKLVVAMDVYAGTLPNGGGQVDSKH